MIVPVQKSDPSAVPGSAPGPQPSEAQLLMALTTMHSQGRFDVAQRTGQTPEEYETDKRKRNIRYNIQPKES